MASPPLANGVRPKRKPWHDGTPTRPVTQRTASLLGLFVSLALLVPAEASRAAAQDGGPASWMSRDEIIEAFVDRQLSGVYPSGTPWSELVRADGSSDYREGAARREGRRWMRGDQFCFAYALPHSGGCFKVVRIGNNCYELYSVGAGGGAEAPPSGAKRHWNGRMWRDEAPATCQELPTT